MWVQWELSRSTIESWLAGNKVRCFYILVLRTTTQFTLISQDWVNNNPGFILPENAWRICSFSSFRFSRKYFIPPLEISLVGLVMYVFHVIPQSTLKVVWQEYPTAEFHTFFRNLGEKGHFHLVLTVALKDIPLQEERMPISLPQEKQNRDVHCVSITCTRDRCVAPYILVFIPFVLLKISLSVS